MKYAKLVNGSLRASPKNVEYNGRIICNPKEDILLSLGYLPVTYTNMPTDDKEGQHYEPHWEQGDTEIVQVWELVEDVVMQEAEPTMQDIFNAIERGLTT